MEWFVVTWIIHELVRRYGFSKDLPGIWGHAPNVVDLT